MRFCANCGSDVQGRFCAKCGTPVAAPPPGGQTPYTPPLNRDRLRAKIPTGLRPGHLLCWSAPGGAGGFGRKHGVRSVLSARVLTGVLFLVLEPYNKNRTVRFHAFQAIFTCLALVAIGIAFAIVASIIAFIPFIGWTVSVLLWPLYGLAVLALWLALMYKAYNRERWVLPVIGPLAEKQA